MVVTLLGVWVNGPDTIVEVWVIGRDAMTEAWVSGHDAMSEAWGDTRKTSFSLTALISNIVGYTSKTQKCFPNQMDLGSESHKVSRAHAIP